MTLKDLADLLQLSPTTVSRALNGYPEVNAETRERVQRAAREHNYTPNNMAQRLATGRAKAIGHVITFQDHQVINPFFAEFMAGASETYSTAGYDMVLSMVPDDAEEGVYRQMAARRSVDGVILHNLRLDDRRIELMEEVGLTFVVHGRAESKAPPYTCLDISNRRAFLTATQHLIETGHRRIALMSGVEHLNFAHRRKVGYLQALEAANLQVDPALMRHEEMTEGYGYNAMRDWLTLDDPPTAVLSSSMLSALGAQRALSERGLKVGKDISIITHDDMLSYVQNSGTPPIFTATRSSLRLAGVRTAEMIISMIEEPDTPVQSELWDTEFVLGLSTGPGPFA